ncbi:MAG: hydroxymethylbilane synthase [Candidatus Symbiobacter sp.]|nr:hydroxymethylbilane synthase [Candidatus Symbiobacter sp.]
MLRIGTRNSPLALAQAHSMRDILAQTWPELAAPEAITIVPFVTEGDRSPQSLAEIGGKGLFTIEIENALATGRIDLAVHSMKDLPTRLPDGLVMDAVPKREDPRDLLVLGPKLRHLCDGRTAAQVIAALPSGCKIGSAALRRKAQLLHRRPDLEVVLFRGNVATRLRKLESGVADATLLALAGINRLGLAEQLAAMAVVLEPEIMLPAVAQGALALEYRQDHPQLPHWLAAINHPDTQHAVIAERAMLEILDGSCRTPIASYAEILPKGHLRLRGLLAEPDGSKLWQNEAEIFLGFSYEGWVNIGAMGSFSTQIQAASLGQMVGKNILQMMQQT